MNEKIWKGGFFIVYLKCEEQIIQRKKTRLKFFPLATKNREGFFINQTIF